MAVISDYKCQDCRHVFEHSKQGENFPENGVLTCPECKSKNTNRIWSFAMFDVAEGECGNAKNGYAKSFSYQPSNYSPKVTGKYRGA